MTVDGGVDAIYGGADNTWSSGYSSVRWTTVYAANGTINTSDRREKSNIRAIENGRDVVMAIKPAAFTKYKQDRMGFIAQEVRTALAKFHIGGDTVLGNEAREKIGMFDTDMIAPLWSAVRSLIPTVDRHDQEISQLKREITEQQSDIANLRHSVSELQSEVLRRRKLAFN